MDSKNALNWLLENNQPSIRYLALTELLGKPQDDSEVQSARHMITKIGWAAFPRSQEDRFAHDLLRDSCGRSASAELKPGAFQVSSCSKFLEYAGSLLQSSP